MKAPLLLSQWRQGEDQGKGEEASQGKNLKRDHNQKVIIDWNVGILVKGVTLKRIIRVEKGNKYKVVIMKAQVIKKQT